MIGRGVVPELSDHIVTYLSKHHSQRTVQQGCIICGPHVLQYGVGYQAGGVDLSAADMVSWAHLDACSDKKMHNWTIGNRSPSG